jgi:hypothetical protein
MSKLPSTETINKRNQAYWKKVAQQTETYLKNEVCVEMASKITQSEAQKKIPIFNQKSFDVRLAAIAQGYKKADQLIALAKNEQLSDFETLLPVDGFTILAIIARLDSDVAQNIAALLAENEKLTGGLEVGRIVGVRKRQESAKEKMELMRKAIDALLQNKQRQEMTIEKIADFLIERNFSTYKRTTTIGKVKKIIPAIRAKYESGQ